LVDPDLQQTLEAYDYVGDDPANDTDPTRLGKQQPPTLTAAEAEAVLNKQAGLPYDKALYNSAQRKIKQGGKFEGEVNEQKQRGQPQRRGSQNRAISVQIPPYQPVWLNTSQSRASALRCSPSTTPPQLTSRRPALDAQVLRVPLFPSISWRASSRRSRPVSSSCSSFG
jgi:hypothetical protein